MDIIILEKVKAMHTRSAMAERVDLPAELIQEITSSYIHLFTQNQMYEEANESTASLVKEIDVSLNGENAAKQASLCDLVAQIKKLRRE